MVKTKREVIAHVGRQHQKQHYAELEAKYPEARWSPTPNGTHELWYSRPMTDTEIKYAEQARENSFDRNRIWGV